MKILKFILKIFPFILMFVGGLIFAILMFCFINHSFNTITEYSSTFYFKDGRTEYHTYTSGHVTNKVFVIFGVDGDKNNRLYFPIENVDHV